MNRQLEVTGWCALLMILTAGNFTPARADTLLHYDFRDGSGTTVTDRSGLGHDGTLIDFADTSAGAGEFRTSEGWVTEGGLSFLDDDVRSYVETPLPLNALGLPDGGNGSHTLEFLASYAGSSGWTPAIASDFGPDFSAPEAFFFGIDNPATGIELRTPSATGGSAGTVGPHPWTVATAGEVAHHVAFVYRFNDDELETFVDGQSIGVETTDFNLNLGLAPDDDLLRIGNTGHEFGEQWAGVVTGTAISASALSPDDFVLTNGSHSSTLLHYNFSDGDGEMVTDLSGQGNDGELVGFLDTSAEAGAYSLREGWVAGGGLSFLDDDQRSYVETPLEVFDLEEDFTIEVTANYASPTGWSPLIGSGQNPFSNSGTLFVGVDDSGTQLHLRGPAEAGYAVNVGTHPWLTGGGEIPEALHHIAVRFDEGTGTSEVFIDGESIGTVDRAITDFGTAESLFRIGNVGWASQEQWSGVMEGIAISDAYLDPEDFVLTKRSLLGDYNDNGELDAEDLDLQASEGIAKQDLAYDLNNDGVVDFNGDRQMWLHELYQTYVGDADLNHVFDSADFVAVFVSGKYELELPASWPEGDWDGNQTFDSSDFVVAFSDGGYEQGLYPTALKAVPEPHSMALALLSLLGLLGTAGRRQR